MNWKKYFDVDLKTTLEFAAIGIVVGYVSFLLKNNMASLAVMLAIMGAGWLLMRKMVKEKKDAKWWLGNGLVIYAFSWFVSWTIFYNVLV